MSEPIPKRCRGWCYTLNNYTDGDKDKVWMAPSKYHVQGFEKGESGTPHIQGYVEFKTVKALSAVRKFAPKAHWEPRKGSPQQAADYCKKDGDFREEGKLPRQGQRTDLIELKERLLSGTSVENLVLENPVAYHQYGRTLEKIESIRNRSVVRSAYTRGIWLWGPTGVGKSHIAFSNYSPETHYVWKFEKAGWQDDYTGQETVIIEDFRGEIKYNDLLKLLDKYPYTVPRRNRAPAPFLAKTVFITSSLPPERVYKNREKEDQLAQLLRRCEVRNIRIREDQENALTQTQEEVVAEEGFPPIHLIND